MKLYKNLALAGAIGIAVGAFTAAPAAAGAVEDFYKGKQITIWVGYSPGGGYDRYARAVARYLGKYIPGNPRVIVKNRPGAGSLLLTNELYNKITKDGTAIGVIGRGMPMEPLLGNKKAKFDASKFNWLGSANNEVSVCISWHTSGITSFEDLKTKQMIVGGTGPGADTDTFPKVLNNLLGTKLKLVTGYPGGTDVDFAVERGELTGRCGYSWSSLKSRQQGWLRDKKVNILIQMSTAKHPDLPDVPFIMDMAKTEMDKKVLSFIFARQAWGRPFLAPPDVPEDRVNALRIAFLKVMEDPDYVANIKKQRLEVAPISGEQIALLMANLYASPPEVVAAAKAAVDNASKIDISKAVIPIVTIKGEITKIGGGGRSVSYKGEGKKGKLSVSGSRTKVTIAGAKTSRKKLTVGMPCTFTMQGSAAKAITC